MRIEELMALVQEVIAEQRPLEELQEPLQAVLERTAENLENFLEDSKADWEMPAATRNQLAEALEHCLDQLEAMQDALGEGYEMVEQCAQEALEAVQAVRDLQIAHESRWAQGPTAFAFINRLLWQIDQGKLQQVQDLLEARFAFMDLLREELALRLLTPKDSQVVFSIQSVLDTRVEDLLSFKTDLLAAVDRLSPLLERPARERTYSWLSLQGLDRLSTLLESYQGQNKDDIRAALIRSRMALQQSLPPSSPAEVLLTLNHLLNFLDKVQQDLDNAAVNIEKIHSYAQVVLDLGQQVEASLVSQPQEIIFCPETEGLPPVLRAVLEPAYVYVSGRGGAETVFHMIEYLQTQLQWFEDNTAESSEALEEALVVLLEVIEALQAVAGSRGQLQLESATELCREAASLLEAAGISLNNS